VRLGTTKGPGPGQEEWGGAEAQAGFLLLLPGTEEA
jgi:hypothetical protein